MTENEMINALQEIFDSLYIQCNPTHFDEILELVENIAGALRYEFGATVPTTEPLTVGTFEF